MSTGKWNFPEGKRSETTSWLNLPSDRYTCTLHKITECTINTSKWGLKEAIRLGFIPTAESLAESDIHPKEDEMVYITKTLYLAKSEKSHLWQTLKSMATPEEMEGLKANDAIGIQAAYEAMLNREFDVLNEHNNGFNNAQSIFRTKAKKKSAPVEKTGFEDMPDKKEKGALDDEITFDTDDIPF